jgi:hypothetical protein
VGVGSLNGKVGAGNHSGVEKNAEHFWNVLNRLGDAHEGASQDAT